jgi:hypothetical protein
MRAAEAAKTFAAIWLGALILATAAIVLLVSGATDRPLSFPDDYSKAVGAEIVFIGSSLTGHALPAGAPPTGYLGDGRRTAIVWVDGIPERVTNRLLKDAIDAGAETVLLEVNAYAQRYADPTADLFIDALKHRLRWLGDTLTNTVKGLFGMDPRAPRRVRLGAQASSGLMEEGGIAPDLRYRIRRTSPDDPEGLRTLLDRARRAGVRVFLFSPPRPQSAVVMIGKEEYSALLAHLEAFADEFGLPLWTSPDPWPDDHFMDILAHTNERGRDRFQRELSRWYRARE